MSIVHISIGYEIRDQLKSLCSKVSRQTTFLEHAGGISGLQVWCLDLVDNNFLSGDMFKMKDIQCTTESLCELKSVRHDAEGRECIKCRNGKYHRGKQPEAHECCKKSKEAKAALMDYAAVAAGSFPMCYLFITCFVARVFLMQCVAAASKTNTTGLW
uniref:Uncharacterized protein n=1 Tax=Physcomitrium patens TaxID=3218 RepID=A9U466_PHYPA|nr:hypothetical protein PHYPA_007019 [Physcomitrium patens]